MTFSLIAKNSDGSIGVIVASKFFDVGAVVSFLSDKVAVASQAFCKPIWGAAGRARMMADDAVDVLADLAARDEGRAIRQAHMMDLQGRSAALTGADCADRAGHLIDKYHSVARNMLASARGIQQSCRRHGLLCCVTADLKTIARRLYAHSKPLCRASC